MTRESQNQSLVCCDWLTLLGFYPEAEALQLIKNQGVKLESSDDEWLSLIREARATVDKARTEPLSVPEVSPLGPEYKSRVDQLRSDSTFPEHLMGVAASEFAWVEIGKVRSFQPQLNEEYVQKLVQSGPKPSDSIATVKFCLPTRDERPKTEVLTGFNPNTNTFTAVTENLDLRVLGNAQSEDPATGRKIAGYVWGFGLPQIAVAEWKGLYFLKNGYHRAYALLRLGHRRMPCLLVHTQLYQFTGAQGQGMFNIDTMQSSRSPVISDFSSPAAVSIPHRRLRLLLSVHAEVQAVPV